MLKIQTAVIPELFTFVVEGLVNGQDIGQALRENYRAIEGRACLWDMRKADFSAISQTEFRAVSTVAREVTQVKRAWKVAYVVADATAYLIMCKYMMHTADTRVPMEYSVFQDMDAAREWLLADKPTG